MNNQYLELKVITPQKLIAESRVDLVYLPTVDGIVGILPGHVNLVVALGEGEIVWLLPEREEKLPIRGGWAEIKEKRVIVFTQLGETNQASQPQNNESG
ncbi:MAG: F0F1 ATP synthase subunit epsilon [Candidatus Aminicenantes bacterium]|nr:F0F1 ATP synthase subunit epsilon [Candidatus Aminicenantes bacterium]